MSYTPIKNINEFCDGKVIFIFPSIIVGGHELMAIEIIKDIVRSGGGVTVCYNRGLNKLENIFSDLGLDIVDIPFSTQKLEIFHAYFNFFLINKATNFLKTVDNKFDEIILVQGDIELGSIYAHAAKLINCKITSYIPYTHTAKTRNKFLSSVRDIFSSNSYSWCDDYITIYNKAAIDIKQYNDKANVSIIRNKVRDLEKFKLKIKNYDRNDSVYKIFIVGRVYFSHKGHDRLLNAIKLMDINIINKIELNVIGDGPDLDKLKSIASSIVNLKTIYWGWMSEPWDEAYKADLIVIPSRYEGVPLVMLEAIELGVDIIASNVDGMLDYVDDINLFKNEFDLKYLIKKNILL